MWSILYKREKLFGLYSARDDLHYREHCSVPLTLKNEDQGEEEDWKAGKTSRKREIKRDRTTSHFFSGSKSSGFSKGWSQPSA